MPYTYADPEVAFTLDLPDGEIQLIYHTYKAMKGDIYPYWYATDMTESDHSEFDITVDYRFQSRALKGLWLRARAATLDQDDDVVGANDIDDYRIVLNYERAIL